MKGLSIFVFFLFQLLSASAQSKYSEFINQKAIEIKNKKIWPDAVFDKIKDYKAISIGEVYGTKDVPEYTIGLVNLLLKNDRKVLLCLQLPEEDNEALSAARDAEEENPVKTLPFFNAELKDGRNSAAMAELIKYFYNESAVMIYFFDPSESDSPKQRDSLMAFNIVDKIKNNADYFPVILSGNIHSKLSKGISKDSTYKPMAFLLNKLEESPLKDSKILALNLFYKSGSAWNCINNKCGINPIVMEESMFTASTEFENYILFTDNFFAYFGYNGFLYSKAPLASKPLIE